MDLNVKAFAAVLSTDDQSPSEPAVLRFAAPNGVRSEWTGWSSGPLRVWFRAAAKFRGAALPQGAPWTIVLGDPAEWDPAHPEAPLVSAARISYEPDTGALTLHTSIVGLPPIFAHRGPKCVALSSELDVLADLPGVRLELDPVSVEQLGRIGHPVGHRTLFRSTTLLRGGSRVRISQDGSDRTESSWQLPRPNPASWETFIEAQVAAFEDAIRRIETSGSFLSLTAGLDTRAIFATVARQGRPVPAVTMSGVRRSLDARTAARLCREYGVRHQVVTFDERFTRGLPGFVEQASRLSGGLESFDQAPEVYLYDELNGEFQARLSGNLGNQVGRGGTEGVGLRGASQEVLSRALRNRMGQDEGGHWLLTQLDSGEASALGFILQQEIPFSSVGNFSVGAHFATQQSPYANRALIETLALKPVSAQSAPSASMLKMRLRDVRHRFLGEPARNSFQRTLISRVGGFAAHYPINLGWRAAGGVSLPGLALGIATMVGMVVQKTAFDDGAFGGFVDRTGVAALHNFRQSARWLKRHLRDYTRDTLAAQDLREQELFDDASLQRTLDAHFSGAGDHHETVTYALDVALAHKLFCRRHPTVP